MKRDVFKVYLSDTGMLVHMYGAQTLAAVYRGDSSFNLGAVTENAVAESLMKCGYRPAYYANNNGKDRMEIDFVVEFFGGPVAIEVKSGKDRESPSIKKVQDRFKVFRRVMLENSNINVDGDGILHCPLFASAFFDSLDDKPGFLRTPVKRL